MGTFLNTHSMKKLSSVSIDFWNTIATRNPSYRLELEKELKIIFPDLNLEKWKLERDNIKYKYNNINLNGEGAYIEVPSIIDLYKDLFESCGIHLGNYELKYIINRINRLFIKYPPSLTPGCIETIRMFLKSKCNVYICSNTMFIDGKTIQKLIDKTFGKGRIKGFYSDEIGYSKPNKEVFKILNNHEVNLHVGDTVETDGECVKYGIPYFKFNYYNNNFLNLNSKLKNYEKTFSFTT